MSHPTAKLSINTQTSGWNIFLVTRLCFLCCFPIECLKAYQIVRAVLVKELAWVAKISRVETLVATRESNPPTRESKTSDTWAFPHCQMLCEENFLASLQKET